MPKATTSKSQGDSLSKGLLGRNQACHQCRKRKLKCDATLPCAGCVKSHAYHMKIYPNLTPPEPECTYDDPDEVAEGAKGKISRLEARIVELEEEMSRKDELLSQYANCSCRRSSSAQVSTPHTNLSTISPTIAELSEIEVPSLVRDGKTRPKFLPLVGGIPQVYTRALEASGVDLFPTISTEEGQLSLHCWPLNIPPPDVLRHLVDVFFASLPFASRLLHQPTFMAALQQVPTSATFPHVALLHAICAVASLYTPVITNGDPDSSKERNAVPSFMSGVVNRIPGQGARYFPRTLDDIITAEDSSFGAIHVQWATLALNQAIYNGDRILQLLQASVVCAWYAYSAGRPVDTFTWVGVATRLSLPTGLQIAPGYEPLSRLPPRMITLLAPPENPMEAELYRNIFWIVYALEREYTSGTVWPMTIFDQNCSQLMPCRFPDFLNEVFVPDDDRQQMFTPNMLLVHPPLVTDAFTLYVKASILLSKVKDFNLRFRMKNEDPLKRASPRDTPEFAALSQTIESFHDCLPRAYRDPFPLKFDSILYMAHILPLVAMIQLHDPHANLVTRCVSAIKLEDSVTKILDMMYKLCATSYDPSLLPHFVGFVWFVAGSTIIRFMKVKMLNDETEMISAYEDQLSFVKFMLGTLGSRTVIGARHVKLLEDIYRMELGAQT